MCGSGQQAVHFASQAILSGDMEMVIAGGTEMMSHQPLGSDYPPTWPADFPYELVHQGISAEKMAEKWHSSREALDDFAYQSHLRGMHAIQSGYFESQLLPVTRPDGHVVTVDEGVRTPPDRQRMAALKPAFKLDGVVTAGKFQPDQRWSCGIAAGFSQSRGTLQPQPPGAHHCPDRGRL